MALTKKRARDLYDPQSEKPFKLSRSRLENFIKCSRCFYLEHRLGIRQPPGFPFTLNTAVDHLMKKEFDAYRAKKEPHPLMKENNLNLIPFQHPDLDIWRQNFKGLQYHHTPRVKKVKSLSMKSGRMATNVRCKFISGFYEGWVLMFRTLVILFM